MKQIQSTRKKAPSPFGEGRGEAFPLGGDRGEAAGGEAFQLWLRLERTRRLLGAQHKRFCIRSVLKSWYGLRATDDFIWEVCHLCEQEGWNELPLPSLYPRKHREFLRAVIAVTTGISFYRVNLKALDAAYSEAFPNSTEININKKSKNKL